MNELEQRIKGFALELGFDDCRIARAGMADHAAEFHDWLGQGMHGEMGWLERAPERRVDARQVLEGCRSVVSLAMGYFNGERPHAEDGSGFRVARYAWNEDYHELIEKRLKALDEVMRGLGGVQKCYVDTGPVLERDAASHAGVGWNGKSTMQVHRRLGTWFFLAEVLTTLELVPDLPFGDHCGSCTRCLVACPTAAIVAPRRVDARRCLSYLTIEHKGAIPEPFRVALGDRIYGCDDCLEVCPWNRFAVVSRESAFHAREAVFGMKLRDFLGLDDEGFRRIFAKSPIKRIKLPRFLRNVCVALGNVGTGDDLEALRQAAGSAEPLVSEHAEWALARLRSRLGDD